MSDHVCVCDVIVGVRALYKGLSPTIVRAFPANAALFVTYEYTSEFLKNKLGSRTGYTDTGRNWD